MHLRNYLATNCGISHLQTFETFHVQIKMYTVIFFLFAHPRSRQVPLTEIKGQRFNDICCASNEPSLYLLPPVGSSLSSKVTAMCISNFSRPDRKVFCDFLPSLDIVTLTSTVLYNEGGRGSRQTFSESKGHVDSKLVEPQTNHHTSLFLGRHYNW